MKELFSIVCSRNPLYLTGYHRREIPSGKSHAGLVFFFFWFVVWWGFFTITAVINHHEGFHTFTLSPWVGTILFLCRTVWRQSHLLFAGDLVIYKIVEQKQTRLALALSSPNCQIQSGFHEGIQHIYVNLYPVCNLATKMWEYILEKTKSMMSHQNFPAWALVCCQHRLLASGCSGQGQKGAALQAGSRWCHLPRRNMLEMEHKAKHQTGRNSHLAGSTVLLDPGSSSLPGELLPNTHGHPQVQQASYRADACHASGK